jgi:hypothetical protein
MTKEIEKKFAQWTMTKPENDTGERVLAKAFAELGLPVKPFSPAGTAENNERTSGNDESSMKNRPATTKHRDLLKPWYRRFRIATAIPIFDKPAWCFGLCAVLLWCNLIVDDIMISAITPERNVLSQKENYEAQILEKELAELTKCKPSWIRITMAH